MVNCLKHNQITSSCTTPMMRQYLAVKSAHEDYLLFYRMGDFYELFFDDAIIASRELDIVLTKRGKHEEQDIPMCGVPAHSGDIYLNKLIKNGHSVAICEQLESPEEARKRGPKAVVRREVIRILTPGTLLEDSLLDAKDLNYLCCIHKYKNSFGLAWVEISLGDFYVEKVSDIELELELVRLSPKEIIISESLLKDSNIATKLSNSCITTRASSIYDFDRCENRLKQFYKVDFLDGIATFDELEIIAAGALLEYLEHTQKGNIPKLKIPTKLSCDNFMAIDKATRSNLELERSIKGNNKRCLIKVMDSTLTATGGRLLSLYFSSPLANAGAINQRLDNVESLVKNNEIRDKIRLSLKHFPDIERAIARISARRAIINDLVIIRDGMIIALSISKLLYGLGEFLSPGIFSLIKQIGNFDGLLEELKVALKVQRDEEYKSMYDENDNNNGFLRKGYNPQLDNLYNLKNHSSEQIEILRDKYKQTTGVNSLKIAKNNVIGYFVEVSPSNADKVSKSTLFKHKQSLSSAIRYTTDELQKLEIELLLCEEKIKHLESNIFNELCDKVVVAAEQLMLTAQAIAVIDVNCALAEIAVINNYSRPIIDESVNLEIVDGRHPVVEVNLDCQFVSNSCYINSDSNLWLITGPNMAGKSTFLRQNALICFMAQIGSFIPAKKANIGVIDRLFSRIGAADNISQGQSTFMVEMLETAYILNNATNKSLLILDEVGRGTSTYDGLAIACSVVEFIHNTVKARTLFATHYHELTMLDIKLPRLACYTMKIQEWKGQVVFMHEIIPGKAEKSYGIHVAELAGMPKPVISKAYELLAQLSEKEVIVS